MSDLKVAIGARIRSTRKRKRLRLQQVAESAGIAVGFLCDVEHGKKGVGADKLAAVARSLGVSLAYLLRGVDS